MSRDDWSEPDEQGVRTRLIDSGATATLRGRRFRRRAEPDFAVCETWPSEWRVLLQQWLGGSSKPRWSTLVARGGHSNSAETADLLDALLSSGWIELEEKRETGGRWIPVRVEFLALEACRERLGLPNRDRLSRDLDQARQGPFMDPEVGRAADELEGQPAALALRRLGWLRALDRWSAGRHSGTRRDFAYFASGYTKGIPNADWQWLERTLDIGNFDIEPHTPLLHIGGPLLLLTPRPIDLDASPDFIGVTPELIGMCSSVESRIERYRLYENRTSFEHACRARQPTEAVIWLPGHPPRWWRACIEAILRLAPAPALISADPDPEGILIALEAGAAWEALGLPWQTADMDQETLNRLPHTRSLVESDRDTLKRLLQLQLPNSLLELALALERGQIKGEQEGLGAPRSCSR